MRPTPRPPRWSKKTDELVRYVAQRTRPSYQSELAQWLESSSRFSAFLTANKDKVRKKLTTSDDEETRLDVRAELRIAYLLLNDRRFELGFEAYGAHQVGPDLTVTFRANQRFNLEITRIRGDDMAPGDTRIANVVAGKLRQLPADLPNALVVSTALPLTEEALVAATRLLKSNADRARDVHTRLLRLGGIFAVSDSSAVFMPNREARHALTKEAIGACLTALSR
jgi:hypothetical protein